MKSNVMSNEAGDFLWTEKLAIINTSFCEKSIYKYAWQHPGSKKMTLHWLCGVEIETEGVNCIVMLVLFTLLRSAQITTYWELYTNW